MERLLSAADTHLQAKLLQLIEVIGAHSISAKQLRSFLVLLADATDTESINPTCASLLLTTMHGMYVDAGAANFLDFDGIESGLELRSTIDKWPSRAYSFCAWLNLESLNSQTTPFLEPHEPRLFSFLSKDGLGVECFFRSSSLVIKVLRSRGISEATMVQHGEAFHLETGEWYHLAIVHRNARPLGQSEVSFFVNGAQLSPPIALQYPDASGLDGFLATNCEQSLHNSDGTTTIVRRMPLCGQISSVYFFDDVVSPGDISSITSFGADYMLAFQPTDDPIGNQLRILDGKLSSKIWLSYNAKACDGNTCFDTTPESNGRVSIDATLLKRTSTVGTRACVTRKLKDAMNAVGGAKLLFPLFGRLGRMCHETTSDGQDPNASSAVEFLKSLFWLMQRILRDPTHLTFVTRNNGLQAIQWLVSQAPPACFIPETLIEISKLGSSLPNKADQMTCYRCLLFDFHLWIKATVYVQCEAIRQLHHICIADFDMFQHICGVKGLLDILREHYSFLEEATDSNPAEISLFELIEYCQQEWYSDLDLGHILAFLACTSNTVLLHKAFSLLHDLSSSQPKLRSSLSMHDNVALIATWLDHPSEQVRCDTIHLLSRLVVPRVQAQDAAGRAMLYTVITSVRKYAKTEDVHSCLFKASLGSETASLHAFDEADEIRNAGFMVVLLDATLDSVEVSDTEQRKNTNLTNRDNIKRILQVLYHLLESSVQSRDLFYSMAGWQEILIRVFTFQRHGQLDSLVFYICCCLHVHAFQQTRVRGWRVLVESLAHVTAAKIVGQSLIQRRFCVDLLMKLEIVTASTAVWYLDNVSHLMLIVEDLVFGTTEPDSTATDGRSDLELAEAALTLLERSDLYIADFNSLNASELPTMSSGTPPGGLARIACRLFVAVATEPLSHPERVQLRMHEYLTKMHMFTDPTDAVFTYALAKLVQAGKVQTDTGHRKTVARMVQKFVLEFDTILERSLSDSRLCHATLADDEFQRAHLSTEEYELYVPRAYLSAEWVRLLEVCPLLQAESQRSSVAGYATSQLSHFPGYDYSSDVDHSAACAFQDRGIARRAELASDAFGRISEVDQARKLNVLRSQRAWKKLHRSLTHECSPWSIHGDRTSVFWKLDRMEGTNRKRLLVRRNYNGSKHEYASKHVKLSTNDRSLEIKLQRLDFPSAAAEDNEESDYEDGQDSAVDEEKAGSEQNFDEITIFQCSGDIVKPMRRMHGRFQITTTHLYFFPEAPDPHEGNPTDSPPTAAHKDRKWPLHAVTQVHPRRYLLRHSAIEIFTKSMKNYFINFDSVDVCRDVIRRLLGLRLRHLTIVTRRTRSRLLKEATAKWKERQISNFEYIMQVNTLSGRTYNDISQYPIFPWVLSDFSSPVLDLNSKEVYRDLSKPIGALNPERLDYLVERAKAFEDPEMGIPKFLYGSHYSSGAISLYYLVRMEPFTKLAIELQGGTFDHADRMFHSVASTWEGVMKGNQDFKELTPEFFCVPEIFLNQNGFNLGTTQRGEVLGDVVLPPWAASADEFVRVNRLALESNFVSEDLHKWLDLIFGFKQRGSEAEAAHNLFYHLTYEGSVDIASIEDAQMRKATEDQIIEYGQTPLQLFSKPHPIRNVQKDTGQLDTNATQLMACFNADARQQPIIFLHPCSDFIITLSATRHLGRHRWMPFPNFQGSPFTFELDRNSSSRTRIGVDFSRDLNLNQDCFAVTSDGNFLFSCGHWDATFKCSHVGSGRILQVRRRAAHRDIWFNMPSSTCKLCPNFMHSTNFNCETMGHHKDIVTSLSLGEDGQTLVRSFTKRLLLVHAPNVVTGSLDATVAVWDISPSSVSSVPIISNTPRAILYGHRDEITCTTVHTGIGIVASTSKNGNCLLHKARNGQYIRCISSPQPVRQPCHHVMCCAQLEPYFSCKADSKATGIASPRSPTKGNENNIASFGKVMVSSNGAVVLYSPGDLMLHLFNINGRRICSADAMERINAWALTPDNEFAVTGSERMVVKLRCLHNLRAIHTLGQVEAPVCSIAFASNENTCLVSCHLLLHSCPHGLSPAKRSSGLPTGACARLRARHVATCVTNACLWWLAKCLKWGRYQGELLVSDGASSGECSLWIYVDSTYLQS
eukprot:30940_1